MGDVLGTSVRETPRYQSLVLLVIQVTYAVPVSTDTDASPGHGAAPALLQVFVPIVEHLGVGTVPQLDNLVWKVPLI